MNSVVEGQVVSVALSPGHGFSKKVVPEITLIGGIGVAGDAHAGTTVKHRSRVKRNPDAPNLRQVHLIGVELIDRLVGDGFDVAPGVMGENVTTRGIDLIMLPRGTRLALGDAVVEVTGLRNPCIQLDRYQKGLTDAVLDRDGKGELVRLAGVMAVVIVGGRVASGDAILAEFPLEPFKPLEPV